MTELATSKIVAKPTKKRGRIPDIHDLSNLGGARSEMAVIYREVRCARMDPAKGARLVWMLGQIRDTLEIMAIIELQKQLADLESRLPGEVNGQRAIATYTRAN